MLAISPDGKSVAYCVDDETGSRIYIHTAGEFEGIPLDGTEKARAPFFSPDGKRIGFLAKDSFLKHVPVDGGGVPEPVCEIDSPNFSACWMPDGDAIVYSTADGLWKVQLGRAPKAQRLTNPWDRDDEVEHSDPVVLPDGEHILFTVATGTEAHIAMASGKMNDWEIVVRNAASARFARGRLLFAQGGAIRMVPFDPESAHDLQVSEPLREKVYTTPSSGGGRVITHYDVTRDGTLAYAPATAKPTESTVYRVGRDGEGKGTPIYSDLGDWKHVRLSPAEDSFAIDILHDTGVKDVYTFVFSRGAPTRYTEDGMSIMSAFTPSDWITARSTHRRNTLREFENLGADPVDLLAMTEGTVYADGWSSDGNILIMTVRQGKEYSLWHYVRGDKRPKLLLDKQSPRYGRLSPDGRWVAHVAEPEDRIEVYVTAYPKPGELFPVSTGGGGEPVWSKDGKELFYRRADGAMLVVTVEPDPDKFVHGRARLLFSNQYDPEPGGHQHYDVFRDGQSFLMIENKRMAPNRIHVVANALPEPTPAR
jgi:serine/threonine-protein kinase